MVIHPMFIKSLLFLKIGICSFFCMVSFSCMAIEESTSKSQKKLDDVKSAISQQKSTIKQTTDKRKSLEEQLRSDDIAIADVAKIIRSIKKDQKNTQQKLIELSTRKKVLTKEKKQQEQILAKQLRAAYSTGQHDYLKLMLNQENPANIQRTITNYEYLNNARMKEIDHFKETLTTLLQVTTEHQQQANKLKTLENQQSQQKLVFQKSKTLRAETIKELGKELLDSEQLLSKLISEERSLVLALEKLIELVQPTENLDGIGLLKKKLSWPVKGKINHYFGSEKQGDLKWKGVQMSAPVGRQVTTIHNGTVLFSDWLKGYGLVTVIDHGQGYMSLYGHNQTLLKSVGERVETGEPIALIGQSGGQTQPGLYFEIRHDGEAVNPKLWCR